MLGRHWRPHRGVSDAPQVGEWACMQSFPVGFKNSTSRETGTAVEACMAASGEHVALLPDPVRGGLAQFRPPGNRLCHVLRGGRHVSNFRNLESLRKSLSQVPCKRILVDCSHGDSGRLHLDQLGVLKERDFFTPDSRCRNHAKGFSRRGSARNFRLDGVWQIRN